MPSSRPAPAGLLPVLLFLASSGAIAAPSNADCLACHDGQVDPAVLAASPHKDLACGGCHEGFDPERLPHRARMTRVDCTACHDGVAAAHPFHPQMAGATGTDRAPGVSCVGCHGAHDVVSPKVPGSKFSPDRLPDACGTCHAAIAAQYRASAHGRASAAGVGGAPICVACHRRPITASRSGGHPAEQKMTQERLCLSCHLDDPEVRAHTTPGAGFIAAYEGSVHGRALARGNGAAANCVDCHGIHEMKKGFEPDSRVNKRHIAETCTPCHSSIARIYGESVHGLALSRGVLSAPVCTDCHGEHSIKRHTDPDAPVAAANVSAQVCSPCHSSVRLSEKYGIASDRFRSFSDSFHGLAIREGVLEVANCASCHGSHDIRPSSDPRSSIAPANLAATCGQCHPGSNERFAAGKVHLVLNQKEEPALYWIATIYVGLIVGTVGGMFVHNLLDFARKARRRLLVRRGVESEPDHGHALYVRMTLSERLQHATLLLSFIVLVVTGFMLHYPEAWWVAGLRRVSQSLFDLRAVVHRVAGVLMAAASLYHLYHIAFTARGRQFLRDILPRPSDLFDTIAVLRYNLGLAPAKPRFGRFSYIEKSEYWALVWGTMVMAGTGLILWFEDTFIGLLTKLGWDIARTVHFYEAWLATLAILVWHIYFVIFNPDVYPMNLAWLTGTITEGEMAEEHPLELETIRRAGLEEERERG